MPSMIVGCVLLNNFSLSVLCGGVFLLFPFLLHRQLRLQHEALLRVLFVASPPFSRSAVQFGLLFFVFVLCVASPSVFTRGL